MSEHDAPPDDQPWSDDPSVEAPHVGDSVSVVAPHTGHRRGRRRSGCVPILVALTVVAGVGFFGIKGFSFAGVEYDGVAQQFQDLFAEPEDFEGPGTGAVTFEVQTGDSISVIGTNLEAQGVVASAEAFVDAAEAETRSSSIQQGVYRLKKQLPAADALASLLDGEGRGAQYTFTPGKTVEEILKLLTRDTDIERAEFDRALGRPDALGLPADADGNAEGYLFPGSYLVFPDSTATSILRDMVDAWRAAAEDVDLDAAGERLGYTPHELMTVASLVQAEGSLLDEEGKGKIARVIYNRLENPTGETIGRLQLDATVNFALGEDVARLTEAQIASVADSPYNTYTVAGLPPGPIGTPSFSALEAAVAPVDGPWFYYVTVNLRSGLTKFAVDNDEFLTLKAQLDEYCATQSDRC